MSTPERFRAWAICFSLIWLGLIPQGQSQPLREPLARASTNFAYPRFSDWKSACDRLPSNIALGSGLPPKHLLPLKNFQAFNDVLEAYFQLSKTGQLRELAAWLGEKPQASQFFNTDASYFSKPPIPFQPFVQRLIIPAGAEALFHGDFHGDIHSLVAWIDWLNQQGYLRDFKIVRPNAYLIFLGDYTDRGRYGIEVLYTVLRLKLENPDRVVMVRGNHEDINLAARYGFLEEGQSKYGRDFDVRRVMRLYDFLPVVLYLGSGDNFLQCNHGGMEPGFDPRGLLEAPAPVGFQFLGRLRQRQFFAQPEKWVQQLGPEAKKAIDKEFLDFQPESPTAPTTLGFMWNDFSVISSEPQLVLDYGRALVYGDRATRFVLENSSTPTKQLRAVFRAHQHSSVINPMMQRLKASQGVYRHWQEADNAGRLQASSAILANYLEHAEERKLPPYSVWTFNVSPDSVYGKGCDFHFDAFGILTVAPKFEDWKLRVVNLTVKTPAAVK
jgi:hypothetical protein